MLSAIPVIPREGVERWAPRQLYAGRQPKVIPREGVERVLKAEEYNIPKVGVIPREGVERMIEAFREPPKRTIS